MELVATIPGTYIGMRQVGAHLVATGTDGLSTFDISDPALPKPLAVLPIAHFENEDVSADDRVAVVSNDRASGSKGGLLYVVDVHDMAAPTLAATLDLAISPSNERGPGHIANCVAPGPHPCSTLWLTGGARVWVVDLRTPSKPRLVGGFDTPASMGELRLRHQGQSCAPGRRTTWSATAPAPCGSPAPVGPSATGSPPTRCGRVC